MEIFLVILHGKKILWINCFFSTPMRSSIGPTTRLSKARASTRKDSTLLPSWGSATPSTRCSPRRNPPIIGVAFDHGKTFRNDAFPTIRRRARRHRKTSRCRCLSSSKYWRLTTSPSCRSTAFEADDVIGTLATKGGEKGVETYMLTPDKDYGQLVKRDNVFMFRPRHGGGYETIGRTRASKKNTASRPRIAGHRPPGTHGRLRRQLPGCPGVGEKTAVKLINEFGSIDRLLETHGTRLKGKLREKVEDEQRDDQICQNSWQP
jgi:DNA polymerase-1